MVLLPALKRFRSPGDNRRVTVPQGESSSLAGVVFNISVAAFVIGELVQALRVRSGAARANLGAEIVFRLMFFAAILLLAVGRAVVPGAAVGGGWLFVLGAVIGWVGLLLRWWSFASLGRYFTVVLRPVTISRSWSAARTGCCDIRATPACCAPSWVRV